MEELEELRECRARYVRARDHPRQEGCQARGEPAAPPRVDGEDGLISRAHSVGQSRCAARVRAPALAGAFGWAISVRRARSRVCASWSSVAEKNDKNNSNNSNNNNNNNHNNNNNNNNNNNGNW